MAYSGVGIGNLNVQLSSTFNNLLSGFKRYGMGNLSSMSSVVHQENFKVSNVVNQKSVKVVRTQVLGLFVGTITNLYVGAGSLEATTHATVNTLRGPPGVLSFCKDLFCIEMNE